MNSGKIVKQKGEIVSTEKILYWEFCDIIQKEKLWLN